MSFDQLTPDNMLKSVEDATGTILTGFTAQLNSYINRVYELRTRDDVKLIAKFYRPGRWTREAILDEHTFLAELTNEEIPVVAPLELKNGLTLETVDDINFAVFPKRAGRQFELNTFEDWLRLGSLVARIHNVGAIHPASSRVTIDPRASVTNDSNFLFEKVIPERFRDTYKQLVDQLISISTPLFDSVKKIRIHGDLHSGNILDRLDEGLLVIDFDDMAMGPPVQDLWLLLPDLLQNSGTEVELFIEGYEQFRTFDRKSIKCIEPLRAMRMIYFLAWCSRQQHDHQFKKNFPDWGNDQFWQKESNDLRTQLINIEDAARS